MILYILITYFFHGDRQAILPGRVAQSVMCLATDACLTAILGVASSIPAQSHTFVEIDHEIISKVILLLPLNDSFKKGCCQLQAKVCARITGYQLVQACPGKSVVRLTDRPAMTIAVDMGRKSTKNKTDKQSSHIDTLFYDSELKDGMVALSLKSILIYSFP